MIRRRERDITVLCLALLAGAASCVRPAALPAPDAPRAGALAGSAPAPGTEARFTRAMIAHHAQALAMSALVPARTTRADLQALAGRIDATQREEIARMERWLEARSHAAGDPGEAHAHAPTTAHEGMPGMLTAVELQQLEQASGPAFERLFLQRMITHHEGALAMAAQLLTAGGGRDAELFMLVSDIDADQRAEIARMRKLLDSLEP